MKHLVFASKHRHGEQFVSFASHFAFTVADEVVSYDRI